MESKNRMLYLCAGLQSSGTTLISWCFLQRSDLDGFLDARSDALADIPFSSRTSCTWLKTTISSFRMGEQMAHFQDLGWTVKPLLICRDVRAVYASLRTKVYGLNGTTAEDPPLRMRFRRFREDWEMFCKKEWPMVRFDHFLFEPERVLKSACVALNLPWDEAMLTWPKSKSAIFDTRNGNETFNVHRGNNLAATIRLSQERKEHSPLSIPPKELAWLEKEFVDFNQAHGYPEHIPWQPTTAEEEERAVPCFEVTRRFAARRRRSPLKYLVHRMAKWRNPGGTP
jgi:hypothetical protein